MSDLALRLEHVTKRFDTFTAVDDLSLAVPFGCVYGFLGPNGAGKTTTIRMSLSIYEPTMGRVEILGARSALDVRAQIGYLPEEKGLYKKMKAKDLIAFFGGLRGMDPGEARREAVRLLERYGLGGFTDTRCEALSKGMGQKVQVLASVVHKPRFVILDEPFSGLDPVNQQVLEQVILDLRAQGTTIVFSTHIMEHAERLCDRIVLIGRGKRLFDGTIVEAKRSIPRSVRLHTASDPEPLRAVRGVTDVVRLEGDGHWAIMLAEGAQTDEVLRACFRSGIELSSFERHDPSLRDVFLKFVGEEAAA
ncbi:MAG: ATP-binding cassette domain-containing protein [Planctomycetes bacterium]|nr:ATP-binding cassette domain-containing protein [Planctomycetota bacterium]